MANYRHVRPERQLLLFMDGLMRFPRASPIRFIERTANGGTEWSGVQMEGLQFTHGTLSYGE